MRRWLCSLQIGVLIAALLPSVAIASAPLRFTPAPVDLPAQLFARLFGESSDAAASFDAVVGDPMAETPLRDLAFRVKPVTQAAPPSVTALAQLPVPAVNLSDPAFAPSPRMPASIAVAGAQLRVPAVEYYQDADPLPTDAPATQRFDLSALQGANGPPVTAPLSFDAPANVTTQNAQVQLPLHVGRVQFAPHAEAVAGGGTQTSSNDSLLGAGATLDLRAGKRNLGVDLSSALEHATLNAPDFTATSRSATPALGLSGNALPVFVPAYADVSAQTLSTGVTVPVTRSLTANVQYDQQHLLGAGAYGTPGSLDANNTIYGARLTFKLPKSSSAISLSAQQYHYQDNLVPANALTQTNANLNFTIKF